MKRSTRKHLGSLSSLLLLALGGAQLAGCLGVQSTDEAGLPGVQAYSLTGEALYAPVVTEEDRRLYTERLIELRAAFEAEPGRLETLLDYGRNLSGLGLYRDAIEAFAHAAKLHPGDPRPWRFRGHRWITLRRFDEAVSDLERAAKLIEGQPDEFERALKPNARGIDLDTLHENVWYHLALAHYLNGDFEQALEGFLKCRSTVRNDDGRAMAAYWIAMSAGRLGRDDVAREALGNVHPAMDIVEYKSYHLLALLFKGEHDPELLLRSARGAGQLSVDFATIGYGIANWFYCRGDVRRARELLEEVARSPSWQAFGRIAAEADLARMTRS
ncbi:MAG: hypothetical protein ACT4PU_07560 [Planctomycetota bacterium]